VTGQVNRADPAKVNQARQTDPSLGVAEPTHQQDGPRRASVGQGSDLRTAKNQEPCVGNIWPPAFCIALRSGASSDASGSPRRKASSR